MHDHIINLAKKENRKILLVDVITNSTIKEPDFGILDVATLLIHPDHQAPEEKTMLVNPEKIFDRRQVRAMGITESHFDNAKNWQGVASYLQRHVNDNALLVAYNAFSFIAIKDQCARYEKNLALNRVNNVDLKNIAVSVDGEKSSLSAYLKSYHLTLKKQPFDRAQYYVNNTAKLLNAMLAKHGLDLIQKNQKKQEDKLTTKDQRIDCVQRYLSIHGYTDHTLDDIHHLFPDIFKTPRAVSFAITDALDKKFISHDQVANENQVSKILDVISNFLESYPDRKLKPILNAVHRHPGMENVDYIQLNVALNRIMGDTSSSRRLA